MDDGLWTVDGFGICGLVPAAEHSKPRCVHGKQALSTVRSHLLFPTLQFRHAVEGLICVGVRACRLERRGR